MKDKAADFINEEGLSIGIDYYLGSSTLQVDTERAESTEYIEISGCQALKILKNGTTNIVLISEKENCFVGVLTSNGISPDIAVKIAENISFL